ncbi:MAG: SDR family oxidoreductase [Bacteroidetes bacterium]|nr:SDR family oxidoreductase [Bacteroidota bacterium]
MDLQLKGKTAIVTGGASGMAHAVVQQLAEEGANIVIADINTEGGEAGVKAIKDAGGAALFCHTDVSSADAVKQLVDKTLGQYGQIDMLFNIAGPGARGGQLDTDEQEFDRQLNTHFKGVVHCSQQVLPHMMERRYGKIVNMGSFAARAPMNDIPAYCAAFGAIIAYTKNLGRFAAAYNINVNSVSPGNILTPMTSAWLNEGTNMQQIVSQIPLGRVGAAEDVAAVCVFLASDRARHIVATDVNVSGGQVIY